MVEDTKFEEAKKKVEEAKKKVEEARAKFKETQAKVEEVKAKARVEEVNAKAKVEEAKTKFKEVNAKVDVEVAKAELKEAQVKVKEGFEKLERELGREFDWDDKIDRDLHYWPNKKLTDMVEVMSQRQRVLLIAKGRHKRIKEEERERKRLEAWECSQMTLPIEWLGLKKQPKQRTNRIYIQRQKALEKRLKSILR